MNGRPWTQEHTATLTKLAPYAYDHEIARVTGHCVDTVQRHRKMLGLDPYRGTVMRYGTWAESRLLETRP